MICRTPFGTIAVILRPCQGRFDDAGPPNLMSTAKTLLRQVCRGESGDGAAVREADRPSMVSPPALRAACGTESRAEA